MKTVLITSVALVLLYISYRVFLNYSVYRGIREVCRSGAVILDVRTEREFGTGHIAGAVNIPLGRLREEYVALDTAKTYIVCCSHGLRSVKAQSILEDRGFRKVFNGGAWSDLQRTMKDGKQ